MCKPTLKIARQSRKDGLGRVAINQNSSARQGEVALSRAVAVRQPPKGPGAHSAVTDADALVLAVAESPAEALERGHSMRCLMMRRLRAWRVMPRS